MKKHLLLVCLLMTALIISCKKEQSIKNDLKPEIDNVTARKKLVFDYMTPQSKKIQFFRLEENNASKDNKYLVGIDGKKNYIVTLKHSIQSQKDLIDFKISQNSSIQDEENRNYSLRLSKKMNGSSNQTQRAGDGEPGQKCIDWYWIIYNEQTGEIISEIYLVTTCDNNDGLGGGGNGGTNDVCTNLPDNATGQAYASQAVNGQPQYIIETSYGNTTFSVFGEEREANPDWNFYHAIGPAAYDWNWIAHFFGKQQKIGNEWRWIPGTFKYLSTSRDGTIPPCWSVSCNMNSTAIEYIENNWKASATIDYTLSATIPCFFGVEIKNERGRLTGKFPAVK